ncbi:MAG: radical SAM protein [Chitinispirillia bacterium]|nr:radical SAM protein [Chitinispirillia bacterium]MCL2268144.1 radical SAM protein [Chitinispirillia bacterium]
MEQPQPLQTKRLSIVPTLRCTLNCALCSNHMPDFKKPYDAPAEDMKRDIDSIFALFDKIEWLQFVGGEIFLHKDMARVYAHCRKYIGKFDRLILETNATLLPREDEIAVLREYGSACKMMISDYGELSARRDKVIEILQKAGIEIVIKKYYGEDQHFGGWIDNTGLRDYGEPNNVVVEKAASCAQVRLENMHCFQGKLHRCSNSLFMMELGLFEPYDRDYLDLCDNSLSVSEKRAIIGDFYKTPRKSCRFCTWKDGADAKRFSAAGQKVRGTL